MDRPESFCFEGGGAAGSKAGPFQLITLPTVKFPRRNRARQSMHDGQHWSKQHRFWIFSAPPISVTDMSEDTLITNVMIPAAWFTPAQELVESESRVLCHRDSQSPHLYCTHVRRKSRHARLVQQGTGTAAVAGTPYTLKCALSLSSLLSSVLPNPRAGTSAF